AVAPRYAGIAPVVAPGVEPAVVALRCALPFPLARQALAGPGRIGARVLQRHPGHRPVLPARARRTVDPVAQEVGRIAWRVAAALHEALELRVGHRMAVDVERGQLHAPVVVA